MGQYSPTANAVGPAQSKTNLFSPSQRVFTWHSRLRRGGEVWQLPANLIGLVALPLLLLLALYPLLVVVRQSFGQPVTLDYWRSLLLGQATSVAPFWSFQHTLAFLWLPLQHSLVVAGLTTVLATGIGTALAGLTAITDLRYTHFLRVVAILHLILPPFALAITWLGLARALGLPEALTYGPAPMVLVLTLHFYAFAFLLVNAAASNLDAHLIEAAQVLGASPRRVLSQIVWPLLFPAVLASAGFIVFSALAAFAPMQILGGGRQPYYVLATQVYSLYRNSLGDPGVGRFAVGLALVLTVVSLPPFLLFLRLMRSNYSYQTIGGCGYHRWQVRLGIWREPLSLFCLIASSLTIAVPLGVLLFQSLSINGEWRFQTAALTLANYRALFATNQYLLSLTNSFLLAVITATVGVLFTLPIAYSLHRSHWWILRGSLYLLTCLPSVLPGVLLGLTYFVLISRPYHLLGVPVSLRFLYGSLALAVVISLVKHLPFGIQTHLSALMQIDTTLEEAAYVCGASFWRALREVLLPLMRQGTLTAWILLFIFVFKEIDILAFVYAPLAFSTGGLGWQNLTRMPPIMYQVFSMINSAEQPELYAQGTGLLLITCLILLAASLAVVQIGQRFSGDDGGLDLGRGRFGLGSFR